MGAPDKPLPGLNWLDPDKVMSWLGDVDTLVKDVVEVAEDQTDPPGQRLHGRLGARRVLDEAKRSLREQLAFARRGLSDREPST